MSDDTDSNVISLPTRGGDSGGMPDAPDGGDLFYSEPSGSSAGGDAPPESPEGTARELPAIRGPISPEVALRETGMPDAPEFEDEECEEGEYEQPRSLADRLGDWLELRLEVARDRHAGEAPFREAEIARKAALLEARTAQETAMMEQNAKLHTAQMKAKSDKTAARGKADAARSSGSGLGADKGGRSKAGGGSSGGSGRGGGRSPGTNSSGGSGRGSGGGTSPKGAGKGSDRSAGGGKGGPKGNESSGGPKGRQNGSGGSGSGKAGTGKGSSGRSGGKNGSGSSGSDKGGSKGDGGKSKDSPAAGPRAERARGRQERAAARQAARQQRRSANQAANLADRSKDRDQDRAAVQAAREERRRVKAERKAAARAKREAAKAADDRTTLGAAVTEEAQRRWDKRRAAEKDKAAKDSKAKDDAGDTKETTGDKDSEATTKKMTKDDPEKPADGSDGDSATKKPEDDKKDTEKPSDGSGDTDAKDGTGTDDGPKPDDVKDPPDPGDSDDERSFRERIKDFFTKAGEDSTPPEPEEPSRLRPEDLGDITVDRLGGPTRSPQPESAEDDIPDAVIVDDPSDPFGTHVSSPASLPRAPEPHTQRPGTSRPTAQEDPVASEVNKPASGQTGMAAQHRTDITFGEYLMEIVNIAIAAALDKDRAQDLAVALGKVADALRDMAADLVGDHNIATEVVDQITDLADAADRMKQLAERCATECEIASEAARIAATSVGRVYGQDIDAMDDAGLATASSAAHHD
ncbi:ATP/GTP-binding protein [Streptomyces sp. NPDC048383]|uniref:ATP/GTP-binding protein n=1 Tax=Streptomyces sp. NPDC048383 TaxID=3155386 RepID=UPI00341EB1B4